MKRSRIRLGSFGKHRPGLHADREQRTADEFAATFFDAEDSAAARQVFVALEAVTRCDLSGLEPDDCLADLISPPDSLDGLEAMMAIELLQDPERGPIARELLDTAYWRHVLDKLLGETAAFCTWDPETLPQRSVQGVIVQRSYLASLKSH